MTPDDRLQQIDRDIAAALDVTPSPDLVPRIRQRLAAGEAAPRIGMPLVAACACGVLAIGAALVFFAPAEEPVPIAREIGGSAGFAERNPPYVPPDVRRPGLALQTRRPAAPVAARRPAEALRPSSDLAAIEAFMAVAVLSEPLAVEVEVVEVAIAPLEIAPLTFTE
jgi:hypothetical protein